MNVLPKGWKYAEPHLLYSAQPPFMPQLIRIKTDAGRKLNELPPGDYIYNRAYMWRQKDDDIYYPVWREDCFVGPHTDQTRTTWVAKGAVTILDLVPNIEDA